MQYVYDQENNEYIDLVAGICTVSCGHANPRINQALIDQSEKLWHTSNVFVHEPIHEYTKKLVSKFPTESGLNQGSKMAYFEIGEGWLVRLVRQGGFADRYFE